MRAVLRLVGLVVVVSGLVLFGAADVMAAPAAHVKKAEALNAKAMAAFEAGKSQEAKSILLDALVQGKLHGLEEHPVIARSYLLLGLVHVDGLKDEEKGARYFTSALGIDKGIKLKADKASEAVRRVFAKAREQAQAEARQDENEVALSPEEAAALGETSEPAPAPTPTKADRRAERAAEKAAAEKAKDEEKILRDVASAREQEARDRAEEAREKREAENKLLRDLAVAREKEARDREQKAIEAGEVLRQSLTATEARVREEKEQRAKAEAARAALETKYAALMKDKTALEQELAEARRREHERLQKDAAQAKADEKERQRQEKERLALEKKLADTEQREKNEREAKEKLIEERRIARDHDLAVKKAHAQEKERQQKAREALVLGPDLPDRITQKLHCTMPDESPPGADVFVHCVPQPGLKLDELTLHYRPSGSPKFNSVAMEKNKKGWYVGMIPAALIKGSMLQYYTEAQDTRGRTLARNGKPEFPNVAMVNRHIAAPVAQAADSDGPPGLVQAAARTRNGRRSQ